MEKMRVDYEKKYKYLEKIDQPRIVSSDLKIDIFPIFKCKMDPKKDFYGIGPTFPNRRRGIAL